jgi:uncharacterized membrane protein
MVTTYTVLKTIHILAAVIWLGGSIMLLVLGERARRARDDPSRIASTIREISIVAPRTFIPASLVLVITGFWMVQNGSVPYNTWVVLGIIGWGVTFLTGNFFLGPSSKKAAEAMEGQGPTDPAALSSVDRLLMAVRVDELILALIIIDMVIKPGT